MINTEISVMGLKKGFKDKEVLRNVNLSVAQGSIYALLGSNGAGKTTTVRILTTQLAPDAGKIKIGGFDLQSQPERIRQIISVTGQFSAVDEPLTGRENLRLMAKMRHLSDPEKSAEKLLREFHLTEAGDRSVSAYSGGMKRRLDIAMRILGNPQLLFLDEPTTGLDPQSRRSMWNMVRKLKESGITIFLTTQYLEEAEELADRIAILDQGEIIAEGTVAELKGQVHRETAEFIFADKETVEKAKLLVRQNKMIRISEKESGFFQEKDGRYGFGVFTGGEKDKLAEIFHHLYENRIHICDFREVKPSLEDVFLEMICEKEKK